MRLLPAIAVLLLASGAHASPVICLDPGHGGKHDGALGPKSVKEKDLALQIARRLQKKLEDRYDVSVLLTREKDDEVDLDDRIKYANDKQADLFLSIHLNSMPTAKAQKTAHGIETYFLSADATSENARTVMARENAEAKKKPKATASVSFILDDLARTEAHHDASKLAYSVQKKLVDDLGVSDRGVHQGAFVVLMGAQMPAVLVEVGFISHPEESRQLADKAYQDKLADSLAQSLVAFMNEVGKPVAEKVSAQAAEH